MNCINAKLDKAVTEINWTTEGTAHEYAIVYDYSADVWKYIEGTRDMVRDLEHRVKLAKSNVESVKVILSKWSQKPLYQRKDDKKDCLLNLEVFH